MLVERILDEQRTKWPQHAHKNREENDEIKFAFIWFYKLQDSLQHIEVDDISAANFFLLHSSTNKNLLWILYAYKIQSFCWNIHPSIFSILAFHYFFKIFHRNFSCTHIKQSADNCSYHPS